MLGLHDRLSRLPTELLDMIFDAAWAEQRPPGPLNRVLCPFYDRIAWRSIRIDLPARLAQFFEFRLVLASLIGVLRRTSTLKKLALDARFVLNIFLSQMEPTYALPAHLRTLVLTCATDNQKDPYRAAETPTGVVKSHYLLHSWPGVDDLEVVLWQQTHSRVLQFITSFPILRRLQLSTKSPVPDFAGALAALQNSNSLHELVFVGKPKKGWTLPDELEQLADLRSLKLVGEWHRLAPSDIDRICDLPLRRFELGLDSELCLQSFYEALQRGKLPDLQILHLDNLSCRVGHKLTEHELRFSWERQLGQVEECMNTWHRADWTDNFSLETFRALSDMCRDREIKIAGTLARALFVEQEVDSLQADIDLLKRLIRSRGSGLYHGINKGRLYADNFDYFGAAGDYKYTDD
ncbi:hypothetical protein RHOSPDRAFT_31018 [Rhodotorula sp. JG-1b]|nr:hypothetical protein RHOSPDRAFT_31018 [Rhodotorula sp. JG-1b]